MATETEVGTRRRAPLSRERILRAAVALAGKRGLESLTMRTLARKLGVVPMALYKHVANKDDMLDGMVDLVYGEIDLPAPGADWRTAMRERAISAREVLARHPWAIAVLESRTNPGPANLRHHDAVVGVLREAGFSTAMTTRAYNLLDSYIFGFAIQEMSLPFGTPEELAELAESTLTRIPADEYPHLRDGIIDVLESGFDYAEEFEAGLDLILDGIERLREPA